MDVDLNVFFGAQKYVDLQKAAGTQKWRFQEMSFLFTVVIVRFHF